MRPAVLIALALAALLGLACEADDPATVNQKSFDAAFEDLGAARDLASQGDIVGAEARFREMHAFTHRLDSELRRAGYEGLASPLYAAVVEIELNLAGPRDPAEFADQADLVLELMRMAANGLGFKSSLGGGRAALTAG